MIFSFDLYSIWLGFVKFPQGLEPDMYKCSACPGKKLMNYASYLVHKSRPMHMSHLEKWRIDQDLLCNQFEGVLEKENMGKAGVKERNKELRSCFHAKKADVLQKKISGRRFYFRPKKKKMN